MESEYSNELMNGEETKKGNFPPPPYKIDCELVCLSKSWSLSNFELEFNSKTVTHRV